MSESKSVVQWNVSFAGVVLGVLGLIGLVVWWSTSRDTTPERPTPELNFYEEYLVEEAAFALADKMPAIAGLQSVAFVPLRDDASKSALAVYAFHQALRENGRYQSVSRDAVDAALAQLLPDGTDLTTPEQAVTLARELLVDKDGKSVVDAVLLTQATVEGRVGDDAEVFVEAQLINIKSGLPVIAEGMPRSHSAKIEGKWNWAWFVGTMNETAVGWRLFIWAAVVGFAPFALSGLVKAITKREKNRDNAYLVLGFTAFAGLFAWFLVGFYIHGMLSGMMVFGGVTLGGLYSLWACTHVYEKS